MDGVCGDGDQCEGFDDTLDTDDDIYPLMDVISANDPDNDIDGDGICGNVDSCPNDADNDVDEDDICGDVDICPFDG